MAFFDPPQPPEPRPAPQPPPVWAGPPANTLPAALATSVVLGRTDDTVIALTGLAAYPTGCDLRLEVRSRRQDIGFPFGFAHHHGRPADGLLVGVLFSDGRKASCPNTGSGMGAMLTPRNGSGGGGAFTQDLWLWPLPPAGAVELFVAWPELGIPESSAVLDGAAMQTAAGQSVELWAPAAAPEADSGWYAFGGTSVPPGVAMPAQQVVLPAPGTPPADSEAASAGVRSAFEKAFTAVDGGPLELVVQDGAVLAGALAQARSNFPQAVGTAWVAVAGIVFLDPDRAAVSFTVHYTGGAGFGQQLGYAVLDNGKWKVSYETYARVLGWAGVTSPPPPPRRPSVS